MKTLKRIVGEEADFNIDDSHYNTLEELNLTDIATAIDGSRSISEGQKKRKINTGNKSLLSKIPTRRFWFW